MYWTKGFTAEGVEGENVVSLLQAAFKRRNLNIKVTALVNDTVGTLISHAYSDPQTYVGVILGTGANAAYVEKVDQIGKWKGENETGEMVINTEWGAFDEEHSVIPFSKYDMILDRKSKNAGKQIYEKMIGGMYLGEVVRITSVELMQSGDLFANVKAGSLFDEPYKFETAYMSRIERDHSQDLSDVNGIVDPFNLKRCCVIHS
jgi:hexokinase